VGEAAVRLRVHLRTGVVEDVVRTQGRGGVPRQLDRELQVGERVGTGVVLRIRGTVDVNVVRGVARLARVRGAAFLHARVVAGHVGDRVVPHLPVHAQVRADAEDARIADVAFPAGFRRVVGQRVVLADVAAL